MIIRVLGSAAGGGVPQWNCNCRNCLASRVAVNPRLRRTQSSICVSQDGKSWLLVNSSPDFPSQAAAFPKLAPGRSHLRGTAISAVALTDGEMDHVGGLLSLRGEPKLHLLCTVAVRDLLSRDFPLLDALMHYCQVRVSKFPSTAASLRIRALELGSKAPLYAPGMNRRGMVTALRIESRSQSMVFLPALPEITKEIEKFVAGCDCLLVDGTFWSEDEMVVMGITRRNSFDMGHVPISGASGSLSWLRTLKIRRKVYTHINNTNPILRESSSERRAVERAGVEVAYDGMEVRL